MFFGLRFSFKNNKHTNVILLRIFENSLIKNTDQNNICASFVFKAKTKEKYKESFLFQNSKMHIFGGHPIFYNFFYKF